MVWSRRAGSVAGPWLLCLGVTACTNPIELETDGAETGGPPPADTSADGGTAADSSDSGSPAPTERQVDILFVVDNSGSMGEEQGLMATGVDALLDALEGASPPVDYRVGVTTSDNGNPWCQGTGPEGGALRATSCRSRPEEFFFPGVQVGAFDTACDPHCELEAFEITDGAPWIQVDASTGTANVAQGQARDAIRCMLPQGIDGCGFESQLESTWKAVRRFATEGEASFGFHRPGALLAIIVVTDEADCSHNSDWETIFSAEGNRVFWSDPQAEAPTSAVCWNAGVACTGRGTYDDCVPVNLDVDGQQVPIGQAQDDAVLLPVERFTSALTEVGAYVVAMGGVQLDGSVTYADSPQDPQFQGDFGIGPGCTSSNGDAVPPVRLRHVVEQVAGGGEAPMYSICRDDYSDSFGSIARGILERLP